MFEFDFVLFFKICGFCIVCWVSLSIIIVPREPIYLNKTTKHISGAFHSLSIKTFFYRMIASILCILLGNAREVINMSIFIGTF